MNFSAFWTGVSTFACMLVGGGVGYTFAYYRQEVTNSPWWAALGTLVGLVVRYAVPPIASFCSDVGKELRPQYVKRCAERIDIGVQEIASGYYRYYLRQLVFLHRNFNVKGLSDQGPHAIELEHVFVELSLHPESLVKTSNNPTPTLPEELTNGSHSVWEWLKSETLRNDHFVILGAPGTGKTTLMQNVTLALATRRTWRMPHSYRPKVPRKIPVLLFLRDVAPLLTGAEDDKSPTLADAIRHSLKREKKEIGPVGWFEKHLKKGRCLVMLDGLDEVADTTMRRRVVDWVQQQINKHGNNRFLITSRPFGYRDNPLQSVSVLGTRPFSSDQVQRFVRNWYLANELKSQGRDDEGVHRDAERGADDLLHRLNQTPALAELAINPLLLTMIAHVHRFHSRLPGRRVELYQEICLVFLGRKHQAAGIEIDLTPQQKQLVLQPLAYYMMGKQSGAWGAIGAERGLNARDITVQEAESVIGEILNGVTTAYTVRDFLKMIEHSSGLIIERGSGIFTFSHLTYQEYLAATHLHDKKRGSELLRHVSESWWHETILLYVAQGDGTALIEECLRLARTSPLTLMLALECAKEAATVRPDVRRKVQKLLDEGIESKNSTLRRMAAEALLLRRLHNLRREGEDLEVDISLVTYAEYQLFLDEKRSDGKYFQPDHWTNYQFSTGCGQRAVVGVRAADAETFCDWLTEWQRDGWHFRIPYYEESFVHEEEPTKYWARGNSLRPVLVGNIPIKVQIPSVGIECSCLAEPVFARAFNNALGRNLTHDFTFDLTRELDHDRALDLKRALDLARDLDVARDLARARTFALDLARDLARDLTRDLKRDLIGVDVDAGARILVGALASALASDLVVDLNRYLDGELPVRLEKVREQAQNSPLLARLWIEVACATNQTLMRSLEFAESQQDSTFSLLRTDLRHQVRLYLLALWFESEQGKGVRARPRRRDDMQDKFLDIYIGLLLLEERIAGRQEAFEGIRIVRERAAKRN